LIHPTNINQGNGGVISRSVSIQLVFKEEVSVIANEKRLMAKSHAVENEIHEIVKAEDDNRYKKGNNIGERTETNVKSQNPGQFI
jgi:hypothetical protein